MRKFIILFQFTFILALATHGQTVVMDRGSLPQVPLDGYIRSQMTEVDYQKRIIGSGYLNREWIPADLYLRGDSLIIKGVDVKIDLVNNVAELRIEEMVKILPSYKIDHLELPGELSGEYYSLAGLGMKGPNGFYKKMYDGPTPLYVRYTTRVKEASYNVALDAGQRDDEILIVEEYYTSRNGNLIQLKNKKSDFVAQLNGGTDLLDFIKKNKINLKNPDGLIMVLKHVDQTTRN